MLYFLNEKGPSQFVFQIKMDYSVDLFHGLKDSLCNTTSLVSTFAFNVLNKKDRTGLIFLYPAFDS